MHLALTDRLSCPRCGPEFGLILLANDVRDHRVLEGELGCSNCRGTYPVRGGFGDLRIPPGGPLPSWEEDTSQETFDPDETVRLGALLGVTEGPGTLLLRGPAAAYASSLSRLIQGAEVVAMDGRLSAAQESKGVSRMVTLSGIPFFSASFKGALLSGEILRPDVEEGARVLAPSSRLVALEPPPGAGEWATAAGLKLILEEEAALVAVREAPGTLPLVTLRGL